MSGVFGVLDSKRGTPIEPLLTKMGVKMSHREWYVVETYSDENAGVGLGRIGIGIFNRERQPICSEDESLMVFLSGELYSTAELRRDLKAKGHHFRDDSDLELILRLYEEKGEQFIYDLEGVFVLAIWDRPRQQLIVANDRFGLYPLYYAHYDGTLVFAPEVKGILADAAFEKKLDLTAMAQFLRFQRLLGDYTFFEGLYLLPYASLLRFDQANNTVDVSHYWDFDQIPTWPDSATFDDAVAETGRLLRRAVEVRTRGEHRLGVYLSGGLDSRTLLGLASQIRSPVVSLTYGVPGCRDAYYAERIARRLGSPHHFVPLKDGRWVRDEVGFHLEVTEGFVTWTHSHAAITLRPARELMDVNLTGFNGDQLLGARAVEHSPSTLNAVDDLDFAARMYGHFTHDYSWPGLTEAEEKLLFSEEFYPQIRDRAYQSLMQTLTTVNSHDYGRRIDYLTSVYQGTRLSNMNIVYQRAFLEARYPFCDYKLVDWVYSMPLHYRLGDRVYLAVINRGIPKVTWIPRDTDERLLTNHQMIRGVHALWQKARRRITGQRRRAILEDPEGWLRRDLRDWAEDLLFAPRTLERGFYHPAFVRSLFERHMSGREVHTIGKIAPIMTYEMMLRRFYD